MGQEDDAHAAIEADRLRDTYAAFAADPRRRRAWAADNRGNQAMRAEVADWVRATAAAALDGALPLLDAGCGNGYWLGWLEAAGVVAERLHGVDLIDARVDAARAQVPGATVRRADARELPYPDAMFGAVLLFTVLSSQTATADMARTLAEARRVLAPGGVVLVWDVRHAHPLRRTARVVPEALLRDGLAPGACLRTGTLLPPLARRLGPTIRWTYPALRAVPVLRGHWLASGPHDAALI